ncbi:fluoride transmembrane transporter [Malassezia pachydermatis]|uniref:Chromosome condensation n=1 Tax=Malassezia pachydermatis TaxID=77020 RepID=A0A0M9VN32_9BASI|nr:chromosome condensation [Malassezia pachydermatis]KOS12892.1 chromosome condensation [Malassezia pachydermatis]
MSWLAPASLILVGGVWGTLARLGLVALNQYDGQSIAPLIWAQGVGCLVMGWASHKTTKAAIEASFAPAFPMLTTGFAGCCTSFSSWVLQVFEAFANTEHFDRHGLHNVMDALTQTAATLGIGIASFWAGRAVGDSFPADRWLRLHVPKRYSLLLSLLAGVLTWVGAALLCGLYAPFRHVTWSLVFCPLGAWLRWQLARLHTPPSVDKKIPMHHVLSWPIGTFLANILGTMVLCGALIGQQYGHITALPCGVLQGLQDGFAGSLSTVSTFISEAVALRPLRTSFAYLFVSWSCGVILSLLLVGVPTWTLPNAHFAPCVP